MRTIQELLETLLKNRNLFERGLCKWVNNLYIKNIVTVDEYRILNKFINHNQPAKYISLVDFMYREMRWSNYYWKCSKISPRISWIKHHIKKLNKIEQQ